MMMRGSGLVFLFAASLSLAALPANSATSPDDIASEWQQPAGRTAEYQVSRREDHHSAKGSSRLAIQGPAIAGTNADASITYTTGIDLVAGAGILLRQHWQDPVRLQIGAPAADNHVSLSLPESSARFETGYENVSGVFGGMESPAPSVLFTLVEGRVPAGSVLRFDIRGLSLPTVTQANWRIPLSVRESPGSQWLQVPATGVAIVPGELQRLSLKAESLVTPGTAAAVWLRLEDAYGNLVPGRSLLLDVLVNGTFRERVEVDQPVSRLPAVSFDLPGVYVIEVRTGGGGLIGQSNPIIVDEQAASIVWADFGVTTTASDGVEDADEVLDRRAGEYDLVIPGDHEHFDIKQPVEMVDGVTVQNIWRPTREGGPVTRLSRDAETIDIAWAENPTDLRRMLPSSFGLVEVIAAGSHYSWLGQDAADRGFFVGFIGSNHSHQYHHPHQQVYTAVVVEDGQDWFAALQNRQTYVTVGTRAVLLGPGGPLPLTKERELELRVVSDRGIKSIRLFKNGSLAREQRPESTDDSRFELSFFSSSQPFGRLLSKPRNAREWIGYVSTRDVPITVSSIPAGWYTRQTGNNQRVDFLTRTHGAVRTLPLTLNPSPDTVLEISIAAGFEDAAWLPTDRLPQPTPAERFVVPLSELEQGQAERTLLVDGYKDQLTVSRVSGGDVTEMRFRYTDPAPPRTGDYYHYEVLFDGGGYAISSPIYVGQLLPDR